MFWPFSIKKQADRKKVVTGVMPTEEGVAFFTPLVSFEAPEFDNTVYVKGARYTLRKHNLKLAKSLHKWTKEGKVSIITIGNDPLFKVIETGEQ